MPQELLDSAGIKGLTDDCHHYYHAGEVPWDLQKYFAQRYSLFSRYDDGIYLTDDAWFGVTPEAVAIQVAKDMHRRRREGQRILIDLFAGAGGNTIAFAQSDQWDKIIAIEKDEATLACAQNNSRQYDVEERITFAHVDCFEYLERLLNNPESLEPVLQVDVDSAVIFASPPWGGPGYSTDEIFDLSRMEPYNLTTLHMACRRMDHALYLPRTSDLRQIARLSPAGKKIDVVQYCMRGASKALVAYIPATENNASNS